MKQYELIDVNTHVPQMFMAANFTDARAAARVHLGVKRLPSTVTIIAKTSQIDLDAFFSLCYISFNLMRESFLSFRADRQAQITIKIRNAKGLAIFGNQKELKRQLDKARTMHYNG